MDVLFQIPPHIGLATILDYSVFELENEIVFKFFSKEYVNEYC